MTNRAAVFCNFVIYGCNSTSPSTYISLLGTDQYFIDRILCLLGTDDYFISAFISSRMMDGGDIDIFSNMTCLMNTKFLFLGSKVMFCFVFGLFYPVLFCFVPLFCSVLFCVGPVLFCRVLFCFVPFCFVLIRFVLFCPVLFCFVPFCFVL